MKGLALNTETDRLSAIVQTMREPIQRFIDVVQNLSTPQDSALSLYGAITTPSFNPKRHVARSVLVLPKVDLSMLRKLSQHGVQFGKVSISAPLIMTSPYIKASLDTFPLELIEIQQFHVTVFGDDQFKELSFDHAHVRLQCERELKIVQIGLRQGLLAAAGREKFISALESDTAEGLLRTLRGILWLKDQKEAASAENVVTQIEKLMDRKLTGLRNAMDANAHHGWDEFELLYYDVEAMQEFADGM